MAKPPAMTDQDRADLVAYLDGELAGESARRLEAMLALNPAARAEAEELKRTWALLDYLPQPPEPSGAFSSRTLSKVVPVQTTRIPAWPVRWRGALLGAGWAAAMLMSGLAGYAGFRGLARTEPGDRELVRDLRLIEHKRSYDLVGDLDFLKQLDDPELFGPEAPGR
jgi:anti-sigma factor RsiW